MIAEPDKVKPVLQPTKDYYRLLAENISDVIFTLDLNLRYTYCSPSVERLRGYAVEEVMGQTLEQVLTPASFEVAKKTVEENLAQERAEPRTSVEPQTLELELTCKGGGTAWAEVKVSFLHDASGALVGILGVSRDITENRRAHEALRESEEKHRLLFQKSSDPVFLLDGDTYVDCNEAALNFMGCSRHQLIGLHPWDVSPDRQPDGCQSRQKAQEIIEATLREGAHRFEWLHRTFSGQELWAEVCLTAVPIGGRKIVYAVWREIDKRKRAEEALIISRLHLSEAMDLAKIVYWELDFSTETFVFNDSFYAFYGTTAEQEGGYRMSGEEYSKRFVHPDDWAMVRQSAEANRLGREPEFLVDLEHRIVRRDGQVRHILARTRGFRDARGSIVRCYGANQDITERKTLENQLLQAQKMEALGTLAGGIAHDFNNVLAAIIGFAELIQDRVPKESREAHHVSRVLAAGIRGRELVRQMLTFSRKTEQEYKPLRLSSIVEETVTLLRASAPTTIAIRVNTRSESGLIRGDPTRIQQILMNLCTNSLHAMQEKGGTLDLELSDFGVSPSTGSSQGIEPGLYVRLVVRDTGIGIPPEIVDRIFDPFFTTKSVGEGTGLGLSVALGIVKQSNGYITVASEPGSGSTFTVYFPRTKEQPKTDAVIDDELPTGSERVLFVDDEEALVELGEDILVELGYEVTSRMSGKEALALFKLDPSRFDLVITDQTMPELTGVDLAKEVLAIRADMPIIMCTGFSHLVDADKARAAGIKAFAMKPLTKREIARTIRGVLDE